MTPTALKMQPTMHLEREAGCGRGKYSSSRSKCIVGCIFNAVRLVTLVNHLVYVVYYVTSTI
jgi:hypothetical protein